MRDFFYLCAGQTLVIHCCTERQKTQVAGGNSGQNNDIVLQIVWGVDAAQCFAMDGDQVFKNMLQIQIFLVLNTC